VQLVTDQLIETLETATIDAGLLIRRMRQDGTGVRSKPDGSPVTDADQAAERLILSRLNAAAPGVPIVAEESASNGIVPPADAPFFLVDPLDGTREYVKGRSEYTVNIALVVGGTPVLGVVGVPELDLIFVGARGAAHSARISDDGVPAERIPLRARPPAARLTALVSGSHLDATTERFLKDRHITDTRSFGSSLKLCRLATGEGDIYPRFGRTMQWDTAAADAVLRSAGGMTCRADGTPLVYGAGRGAADDPDPFANPSFIAFGAWTTDERLALLASPSEAAKTIAAK